MDIEILLMDHVIFFEDKDIDLMIHADIFHKTGSSHTYPVHIYIRRGVRVGTVVLHRNSGIKLIYSRNKNMAVTVDGNRFCLCPGEFILISNNALYSIIPENEDVIQDVMIISFQPDYLRRMYPCSWNCEISRNAPGAVEDTKTWMAMLCGRLREYAEESLEDGNRHFEINQLLFAILQMIFCSFLAGHQKISGKQYEMQKTMAGVLDYLQEHYRENLTTQFVAEHFWYTREYFCRLFKRYANETFKSYLTEIRLAAVVHEMQISDKSVVQIGLEQGFSDAKSLFSVFKRKYGMTPAQWKARISAEQMCEKEKGSKGKNKEEP